MSKKPETIIEDDFVEWVQELPYPAIALKLVIFGMNGWPDRTILAKGKIFFIEFKWKKDYVEGNQLTWKKRIERLGFIYHVCNSKEQAIKAYKKEIR